MRRIPLRKVRDICEHAFPSLTGILRLFVHRPGFALQLLARRAGYFVTGRLVAPLMDPFGFPIDSPNCLVSYWNMFVEQALASPDWLEPLEAASSPHVVDVGANAGVFSHFVMTHNSQARLTAVEPLPKMAERLQALSRERSWPLTCIQAACADRGGQATLYALNDVDSSATLTPNDTTGRRPIHVNQTTIDTIIPEGESIFLMKIDTEGCEPEVLQGAVRVLRSVRFVIAETLDEEAFRRVATRLGEGWRGKRLDIVNSLFTRCGEQSP